MKCQENSGKTPKCSCCDMCIQVQNAKLQKNNSASENISDESESYFKNFAIPDDLYFCKENMNRVKSYNERALKILENLRQRTCRILESSALKIPFEDEDDEEDVEELEQQQHHSKEHHSPQHQSQQQHSPQHHSKEHHSPQHQSQQQHSPQHHSKEHHSPQHQSQQQHSQQHHSQQHQSQLHHSQQQHSQQHQSHLQQQQQQNQQHHSQLHNSQQHHSPQHQSQQQHSQQHHSQQHHSKKHHSPEHHSQQHHSKQYHSKQHHSPEHHSQQHCSQLHHSPEHHSQQHYSQLHHSQPQQSQQHQSYLEQQEQLHQQEQCQPNTNSNLKLQVTAPCERIQNLGYLPQSNFLKKMKRRAEVNPNTICGPLIHCGCANCGFGGVRCRAPIMCPCCRCNTFGCPVQSMPCGRIHIRERNGPCSDMSSMHDPCTCFRTWRPGPCPGHFPEYQYEILEREDNICAGEAYIHEYLNDGYYECEERAPSKKKGKSGHVSRSRRRMYPDKRKRRSGRRKSKPDEKDRQPPETDFSPSLKRPHPNSCERCWRYASPSRSPVNRPSQRFDPNYRRSHSEVNINSDSKGNMSKNGSHYSTTNYVEFDPETKVHKVMSSVDCTPARIKSSDNINKSSLVRPVSPKPRKRTPKTKGDAVISRIKKESDVVSTHRPKRKSLRSCINSSEKSKEILRSERHDPMPCSPSMFDKKSQRSNSKISTSNRLSSAGSCKENIKIRPRPLSACQNQTSQDFFDKPRAQSFDRNYLNENLCIPPERMRKCCCTKPRTRTVNMNVMCEQPLFNQGGRDLLSEVRGPFGISNSQENPLGFDKPCPGQDGTYAFFDILPCVCSFKDLPESKFMEGLTHCCCQKVPVTFWDRKIVSKEEDKIDGKRNEGKIISKNQKDEESNPRKYCVFYMNKSDENEKDEVEVLIEELTEGRSGKDSKRDSLKSKMKKMQEPRSDSMALRFQKGIAEKCRRRDSNRVLHF